MGFLKNISAALVVTGVACASSVVPAHAINFSFVGTFDTDNEVQFFDFVVGSASTVTFISQSYAGATQADGNVVVAGGFDPILSVFNLDSGLQIGSNDDGSFPDVNTDAITGSTFDTYLELALAAGNYTVALTQYDNFASGNIGDGFAFDGDPNFTSSYGCAAAIFCDVSDPSDGRTGEWAFDILNVNSAVVIPPMSNVPVPAALPLFGTGLAALGFLGWRRKRKAAA